MNELPNSAIGLTTLLPSTQSEVDNFSDQIIKSVKDGEANALKVLITLKAFAKASERILEEIREDFVKEGSLYPEKSFEFLGATVEKAEVATKYHYEKCGDPILLLKAKLAKEAVKAFEERQGFLKSLKETLNIVDDETGEVMTIRPPAKTSTTSLKVTIK